VRPRYRPADAVTIGLALLAVGLTLFPGCGALTGRAATPTPGVLLRRVPVDEDGVTCYVRGEALACVTTREVKR
jgi:hypothetical protein